MPDTVPPTAASAQDPRIGQADPAAPRAAAEPPLLSVVVPVRNEGPNIAPLIAEIRAAVAGLGPYEIVYVDDGSTDETAAELARAAAAGDLVRRRHRVSCGQSAAIITGVKAARGAWIATLDGDGQNDPADIPRLFALALAEAERDPAPVLIAGHRVNRKDTRLKRVTSRIANTVRARLLGDATPDTGCGLKVFRRADFLDLPRFDHMHRFLPALFLRAGGRVLSVPVNHRPRVRGHSNYGVLDRASVALFDLLGVIWLKRRGKRPEVEILPGPDQT
ncbi:MAG: glycosyltransferase [Elioraea sp.]|nr:glycosyltransferase [Elioraea sp.]